MGFILDDSNDLIIRKINEAAIRKISKSFYNKNNIVAIEKVVSKLVRDMIKSSEVWQSLAGNSPRGLDAHFGIPRETNAKQLENLLDIWSKEIKVVPHNIRRGQHFFTFSYTFKAIQADWANVLASPDGVTINLSHNSLRGETPKEIPWLQWLLVSGDQFEIEDYHIEFKSSARSRSGKAFMYAQGHWVVPKEFGACNTNNNFVTRALAEAASNVRLKSKLTEILETIASFDSLNSIDISDVDPDLI